MTVAVTLTERSGEREVLDLPKGRLMVGEIVADFSPENVVEAARNIITHLEHELGEETFYTQAGVLEYAACRCGWNSRPAYKAI